MDAGCTGNAAHDFDDIRAHGRLPSCQADFVETQIGKQARERQYLVVLHQLCARLEGLVFWHAVHTAQVAMVSKTDTQIMDFSSETIDSHK